MYVHKVMKKVIYLLVITEKFPDFLINFKSFHIGMFFKSGCIHLLCQSKFSFYILHEHTFSWFTEEWLVRLQNPSNMIWQIIW